MTTYVRSEELILPEPSIRVVVNSCLTREDLSRAAGVITEVVKEVLDAK